MPLLIVARRRVAVILWRAATRCVGGIETRIATLTVAAGLCACAPSPPPPPPAHVVALQSQCQQGSTEACTALMQADTARRQAQLQAIQGMQSPAYAPPNPY
jgi:hypothetical protein